MGFVCEISMDGVIIAIKDTVFPNGAILHFIVLLFVSFFVEFLISIFPYHSRVLKESESCIKQRHMIKVYIGFVVD